jgi:hypothetical protein
MVTLSMARIPPGLPAQQRRLYGSNADVTAFQTRSVLSDSEKAYLYSETGFRGLFAIVTPGPPGLPDIRDVVGSVRLYQA